MRLHGLYSPWNSLGQNTGVDSCFFLQGIFPTQELNWGLLHCRLILYQLSYQGSPREQRICLQCRRPGFNPWVGKIPWRRERLLSPVSWPGEFHGLYSHKELDTTFTLAFPDNSVGEESTCNAGDPSSIPGLGRSPGEELGYPLQYFWASLVI